MYSSAEEKAKSRQHLIAYIIGCAILLGAYGIWKIIVDVSQDTEDQANVVIQQEGKNNILA